jgi:C4-dicarboxylate-specific signal transduction histidine kinase
LFSHLIDAESREERKSLRARQLAREVATQVRFALRGVELDFDGVDDGLRLPPGRYAEWSAIFQNLYVNSANAMLDSSERRVAVTSRKVGPTHAVYIQDTGTGVDTDSADDLFEPFTRRQVISPERERLGLGGTGMGLTIARMIATNLGCRLAFASPDDGYATAVRISWR